MAYDWHRELELERFSPEWFDAIDTRFVYGARLFATDETPFDRIIPFAALKGAKVLEIGCGMGLHTELMVRAGANVTSVDLAPTSIEATTQRLAQRGLAANILQCDAEQLPFDQRTFDFVWSWGVIHHSSRTAKIVREISRVMRADGEARVMVYNRDGMSARLAWLRAHVFTGRFLRYSFDESLHAHSDGFSARFYVPDQFADLFQAFFAQVDQRVYGQDVDALPLPRGLRRLALKVVPDDYLREAQSRRGAFLFVTARRPY